MISLVLYGSALLLLGLSLFKDRDKTRIALKKAWSSFEGIMPQFLGVIFVVGFILALLKPEVISSLIGSKSGIFGVLLSAIVGSITIMPTFVSFSTAAMLLKNGAGYAQVGALVSTLTMVGIVTFPMEAKYIGRKAAFYRNLTAFVFSFAAAFVIGWALG